MPISTSLRHTGIESEGAVSTGRTGVAAATRLVGTLLLALLAVAFCFTGHEGLGFVLGALALVAAIFAAVKVAQLLARRGLIGRLEPTIEYEFTREGAVYLLIVGLITIASVNTGNNLLFMILAVLLAGMIASGVLSKVVLAGLKLELTLPERLFAGQPVRTPLKVTNTKRVISTFSLTVTYRARPEHRRIGGAVVQPLYAPYIPARGSIRELVELRFARRGRYREDDFQLSTKFPFSILRRKRSVQSGREILVLPSVEPTQDLESVLTSLRGEVERARKGHGCDLYALRGYQDGDSARQVDWKATAKTQKLIVREFTRQEEHRLTIVLDSGLPELSDTWLERFEKAIRLCACLAWRVYLRAPDGSFLQFIGGRLRTHMAPAPELIFTVLEELAVLEPSLEAGRGHGDIQADAGFAEGFPIVIAGRAGRRRLADRFPSGACMIAIEDL